jgi:3-methyl-2-oxobutanoate hydroxymethyltransferase
LKNNDKNRKPTAIDFIARKKQGIKIPSLSLYDAPTAKFAVECGIDLLLVGDSLGMTMLGYENTIPVRLEDVLMHAAAVRRGAESAFVVADMPFMTYQISPEKAMENAARFLQTAGSDGVKLEGGVKMAKTAARLVGAGVPVMGHIGLLPQNVLTEGGYRKVGKNQDERRCLLDDAKSIEDAGAFCIILECIEDETAAIISESLNIPAIGIGSGKSCDGQIQVVTDILGISDFIPKHAKTYLNLADEIKKAFSRYASDVASSS